MYRLSFATAVYATASKLHVPLTLSFNQEQISSVAEFILILRTYALYNSSKRVLVFLLLMFGAHIMVMIMAVIHASPYPLPPGITGKSCTFSCQPVILNEYIVRQAAHLQGRVCFTYFSGWLRGSQTVLYWFLRSGKLASSAATHRSSYRKQPTGTSSKRLHTDDIIRLMYVLARDGILWYGVIVAIDTINVLIYLVREFDSSSSDN